MIKKNVLAIALTAFLCSNSTQATQFALIPESVDKTVETTVKTTVETELHIISNRHINRIVTPFSNPSIKMDNVSGVKTQANGNVLYLSTTNDNPIAAFVTENGDETTAISVVFKPMPVPPKEVVLSAGSASSGYALARRFESASPRTEMIMQVMAGISKGDLQHGYRIESTFNPDYAPNCNQMNVEFNFVNGQFISGGDYVIAVGIASNTSNNTINILENLCYQDGVVAVAVYPSLPLTAGDEAEVFVMYHRSKQAAQQRSAPQRKSLIAAAK